MKLRPYQQESREAVQKEWERTRRAFDAVSMQTMKKVQPG